MSTPTRLACTACEYRGLSEPGGKCPECNAPLRPMGALEGLVDTLLSAPQGHVFEAYHRHVQLVQELWTAEGRAQELYTALNPKVSYSRFVSQVTDLVCRGLEEGWIRLRLPRAPINAQAAYALEFPDTDRFIDELATLFKPASPPGRGPDLSGVGDPR